MKSLLITIAVMITCVAALSVQAYSNPSGQQSHDKGNASAGGTEPFLGSDGWVRAWAASESCYASQVAADAEGNIYVVGSFEGTVDLDPGPAVEEHTSNGAWDFYVMKLDAAGALVWARTCGGPGRESARIAISGAGDVYLAGYFEGHVDFDLGEGVDERISNGSSDFFVGKLEETGSFAWVRTWGGQDWEYGSGIAADDSGNVYVTGIFEGTVDFDPGPGVASRSLDNRQIAIYLSKFNAGGEFQWVRTWGENVLPGPLCDEVEVDGQGNVYVTGGFEGAVDFDPGDESDRHTSNGGLDIFFAKFDCLGNYQWGHTWGGRYDDYAGGIAMDASGYIYTCGAFSTTDTRYAVTCFNLGDGLHQPMSEGSLDVYLSKFDSSGNLQWVRTWGGPGYDFCGDLLVAASGDIYVSGRTQVGINLDPKTGAIDSLAGDYRNFVSRFNASGNFLSDCPWADIVSDGGLCFGADNEGNLLFAGSIKEAGHLDPRLGYESTIDRFLGAFLVKVRAD